MRITGVNRCRLPSTLDVITNGVHYLPYKSVTWPQNPEKRNEGVLIGKCDIWYVHLKIFLNMAVIVKWLLI